MKKEQFVRPAIAGMIMSACVLGIPAWSDGFGGGFGGGSGFSGGGPGSFAPSPGITEYHGITRPPGIVPSPGLIQKPGIVDHGFVRGLHRDRPCPGPSLLPCRPNPMCLPGGRTGETRCLDPAELLGQQRVIPGEGENESDQSKIATSQDERGEVTGVTNLTDEEVELGNGLTLGPRASLDLHGEPKILAGYVIRNGVKYTAAGGVENLTDRAAELVMGETFVTLGPRALLDGQGRILAGYVLIAGEKYEADARGRREDPQVERWLATLQDQDSAARRKGAAYMLGETKDAKVVEPLIAALRDDDPLVRKQVASALRKITGKNLGVNYETWVRWWQGHRG